MSRNVVHASPHPSKIPTFRSLVPWVPVKGLRSCYFTMHCFQAGRLSPDQEADVLLRFIKKAFPTPCGHTWCWECHPQKLHAFVFSERWMKPEVTVFCGSVLQIFPLWEKAACDKWVLIEGHHVLLGKEDGTGQRSQTNRRRWVWRA